MTSRQSVVQFLVALFLICMFVFVLIDNLTLRKRTSTDYETFRSSVHDAITKCQNASHLPTVLGLSENAAAREMLRGIANVVGGFRALSQASGFDCVSLYNTMTLQARQLRKKGIEERIIPEHELNRMSSEEDPLPKSLMQQDDV